MKNAALFAALHGKTPAELRAIHALANRRWEANDRARRACRVAVCEHVIQAVHAVAAARAILL